MKQYLYCMHRKIAIGQGQTKQVLSKIIDTVSNANAN